MNKKYQYQFIYHLDVTINEDVDLKKLFGENGSLRLTFTHEKEFDFPPVHGLPVERSIIDSVSVKEVVYKPDENIFVCYCEKRADEIKTFNALTKKIAQLKETGWHLVDPPDGM
jgi:hypothetical protein